MDGWGIRNTPTDSQNSGFSESASSRSLDAAPRFRLANHRLNRPQVRHAVSGRASRGRREGIADLSARHCLPPLESLVPWEALEGGGRRLDGSRLRVRASFRRLDPASAILALPAD